DAGGAADLAALERGQLVREGGGVRADGGVADHLRQHPADADDHDVRGRPDQAQSQQQPDRTDDHPGGRRPNRLVVRSLRRPKMGSEKSALKAPSEVMMPSVATTSSAATSSCSFRVRPALRGVASAAMTPKRARIIVTTTRAGAFSLGGGIRGPASAEPPWAGAGGPGEYGDMSHLHTERFKEPTD